MIPELYPNCIPAAGELRKTIEMSTPRRSILLAFSERYATLLIYFVSTVILARLLTPAELGVYSVGMAVVTMAHSLRDFGISNFLIQKERLTQEDVFTVCWISVALAWGIGLVILAASGEVAAFYGQPQLRLLIIILAGSFFVLPFSSLRMALLRREMDFGALVRINVGAALVQASLSIVLVACGLSYLGLGLAALMGTVATLLAASRVPVRFRLFGLRFGDWRPVWYFSSRATSMSLIGNLGSASPDLLIGKLVGFDAVGLFSRAMGLVQLVERGIMDGVRGVALPYFAGCHRRDESLEDVYARSLTLLLSVSWPRCPR
jgi:O-antigen/teichoic acid export membrane protein